MPINYFAEPGAAGGTAAPATPAPVQQPPQFQANAPQLKYTVKKDNTEYTMDNAHVVNQLAAMGYRPQGMTPDGSKVTLVDANGPYEIPIAQALGKLGYEVNAQTVLPSAADYGEISHLMRANVAKLPNDDMKRQYLEQALRDQGQHNAQVTGTGRDWYSFDQDTGKYKALTNTPEWDKYDATEALVEAPRVILGSLAAGATGAGTSWSGPGAIPAAAAAYGAGAGVADAGTRAVLSMIDPAYKTVSEENLGAVLKDVGINAGIDTASMGLLKGAPSIISKFMPKTGAALDKVVDQGVVSPVAEKLGGGVARAGEITANVAKGLNTEIGRSVGTLAVPMAGEAELIGWLSTIPKSSIQKLPGWMQNLATKVERKMAQPGWGGAIGPRKPPNLSGRAGSLAEEGAVPPGWIDNMASKMSMGKPAAPAGPSAQTIGGNIGKSIGQNIERQFAGPKAGMIGPTKAPNISGPLETFGRGVGEVSEYAAQAGDIAQKTARGTVGAGLKGIEYAGRGVQGAGNVVRGIGALGSPIESRYVTQRGTDWAQDEIERLRRQRLGARMTPRETFASSY